MQFAVVRQDTNRALYSLLLPSFQTDIYLLDRALERDRSLRQETPPLAPQRLLARGCNYDAACEYLLH